MALTGSSGENTKYLGELLKGRTLLYIGEKYHSYSNGKEIFWSDSKCMRVGTSLEFVLTNCYIASRKQKLAKN